MVIFARFIESILFVIYNSYNFTEPFFKLANKIH